MNIMTDRVLNLSLLCLPALLLCACFSSSEVEEHFYALHGPTVTQEQGDGLRVLVEEFGVAAGYEKTGLAYRLSDHELRYYGYHRWTAGPGRLITEMTTRLLRASGLFSVVEYGQSMRSPNVIILGTVEAIEEIDTGDKWKAHLALRLVLRDGDTNKVFLVHSFDRTVPCSERHPKEVARGVSKILVEEVKKLAPIIQQKVGQSAAASQPAAPEDEPEEETEDDVSVGPSPTER